jgi:hypothetical protein
VSLRAARRPLGTATMGAHDLDTPEKREAYARGWKDPSSRPPLPTAPVEIAHDVESFATLSNPRSVHCPHCGSPAGRACMTTSGVRYRGGAKGQRIDAFEEIKKLSAASLVEG